MESQQNQQSPAAGDSLYDFPLFEGLSADELQWLIDHSNTVELQRGDFFLRENAAADYFYIVLEGELQVMRIMHGKEVVVGTTPRGIIGGELALLNGTDSLVTTQAIVPTRLMVFDRDAFREIFAATPLVGTRIFQIAAQRMQGYAVNVKQQEKMAALGKLAAGLAHELNNPAAAARRSADELRETLPHVQVQTLRLNALCLTNAQTERLVAFHQQAVQQAAAAAPLSPLEQSDREDDLGLWLDEHSVADAWEVASTFVAAQLSSDQLQPLLDDLPAESASDVLGWLHATLTTTTLLSEIEQSSARISELVKAIKSYTYMDKAPQQEVDIHKGLDNTLTVLSYRLKRVTVIREYDPTLPTIFARGGELNQVWTNLIANAIDAVDGTGTIWLKTRNENSYVMVEVTDDGHGITDDVLPRLFEPFFTTRDVGAGTGLGLDITYRIITQHSGTIEVQSQPGHTRFIIRLPIGTPE